MNSCNRVKLECMAGASVDFFWRRKSQYLLACEHLNKQISLQRAQRSKTEQSGNAWQVHLGLFLKEESIPRLGYVHASGKLRVQNCTSQVFRRGILTSRFMYMDSLSLPKTKPASNCCSHEVYDENILLSKFGALCIPKHLQP